MSTILSYFKFIYGDKYTAFLKLVRVNTIILELRSLASTSLQFYHLVIEAVHLVYSLSSADNAVRKLLLMEKLLSIVPVNIITSFNFVLGQYPSNIATLT